MSTPKFHLGDKVVATREIWDALAKVKIPAGTSGTIVGLGIDAQFGLANVTFTTPGTTPGFPVFLSGFNQSATLGEPHKFVPCPGSTFRIPCTHGDRDCHQCDIDRYHPIHGW